MSALHEAYGYHRNDAECRERLKQFAEKTGFRVSPGWFNTHRNLPGGTKFDHDTIWIDIEDQMFFMVEMYGRVDDHVAHFKLSGLPWIRVPEEYAPYGHGTTTYLITFPWHVDALRKIGLRLGLRYDDLPQRL